MPQYWLANNKLTIEHYLSQSEAVEPKYTCWTPPRRTHRHNPIFSSISRGAVSLLYCIFIIWTWRVGFCFSHSMRRDLPDRQTAVWLHMYVSPMFLFCFFFLFLYFVFAFIILWSWNLKLGNRTIRLKVIQLNIFNCCATLPRQLIIITNGRCVANWDGLPWSY